MGSYRFGTGNAFKNLWLKVEAKGRADIANEHFRLESTITAIEKTWLDREVQKYVAVNQAHVLEMATEANVDVPTFCTMLLEESRAANADFSSFATRFYEWWFKEHDDHRALHVEGERVHIEVGKTHQLDDAQVRKSYKQGRADLAVRRHRTAHTIRLAKLKRRITLEERLDTIRKLGTVMDALERARNDQAIGRAARERIVKEYTLTIAELEAALEQSRPKPDDPKRRDEEKPRDPTS